MKNSCSKCEECKAEFIKQDQELQKSQEVAKRESDNDKIQKSLYSGLAIETKHFFSHSKNNKIWLLNSTTSVKIDSRHLLAI